MRKSRTGTQQRGPVAPTVRWLRFLLVTLVVLPLAVWGAGFVTRSVLGRASVREFSVDISQQGAKTLRSYGERWHQASVAIRVGPYVARMSREALGARLPLEPAIRRLQSMGRTGHPLNDLVDLWRSHVGGIEISLPVVIDRGLLMRAVGRLRAQIERGPVPGTRTPSGEFIRGIPGITVNAISSVELLGAGLRAGAETVVLQFSSIAPPQPIAYDDPSATLFTERMTSFETSYRTSGRSWGRARNIENSAKIINGAILPPGGRLSFNERVGERTFERGFRPAKELANRRVVVGIGGGVCQVAATLHAAAFLGGFDTPVYQPHSRPSRYIETGLDTMVAWPNRDLVVRNPYPFSVRISASASDGEVSISIFGAARAHPVEWEKEIVEKIPAGSRDVPGSDLAAGERKVIQKAIPGLRIIRRRTTYLPTGPVTESLNIRYPANDRLVAVGS